MSQNPPSRNPGNEDAHSNFLEPSSLGSNIDYIRKRGFIDGSSLRRTMFPPQQQMTGSINQYNSFTGQIEPSSGSVTEFTQFIYGTDINTNDIQVRIKNFLMNFTLPEMEDDIGGLTYYTNELKMCSETEEFSLNIDCDHLYNFD
jgi:DNA replication licensing factor MCM4